MKNSIERTGYRILSRVIKKWEVNLEVKRRLLSGSVNRGNKITAKVQTTGYLLAKRYNLTELNCHYLYLNQADERNKVLPVVKIR
jgi:hypothetical protein